MLNREQRALNNLLTEEQKDAGLWVRESSSLPNTICLMRHGEVLDFFSIDTDGELIRQVADEVINKKVEVLK